mmetsp:Transcript_65688/g.186422  ORF Transcript_65688/g.186422 Transcript_65688/m.186422 type:complete len:233 (-) Transcript_65688:1001-1699(-)
MDARCVDRWDGLKVQDDVSSTRMLVQVGHDLLHNVRRRAKENVAGAPENNNLLARVLQQLHLLQRSVCQGPHVLEGGPPNNASDACVLYDEYGHHQKAPKDDAQEDVEPGYQGGEHHGAPLHRRHALARVHQRAPQEVEAQREDQPAKGALRHHCDPRADGRVKKEAQEGEPQQHDPEPRLGAAAFHDDGHLVGVARGHPGEERQPQVHQALPPDLLAEVQFALWLVHLGHP